MFPHNCIHPHCWIIIFPHSWNHLYSWMKTTKTKIHITGIIHIAGLTISPRNWNHLHSWINNPYTELDYSPSGSIHTHFLRALPPPHALSAGFAPSTLSRTISHYLALPIRYHNQLFVSIHSVFLFHYPFCSSNSKILYHKSCHSGL